MATISVRQIQKLLDEVNAILDLASRHEASRHEASTRIRPEFDKVDGEIPKEPTDKMKVSLSSWADLQEDKKAELHLRLSQIRDAARLTAEIDGPADPGSIMHRDFTSNSWVTFLTLIGLIGTPAVIWLILRNWSAATKMVTVEGAAQGPEEATILLMISLMGLLGGSVHFTSSLAKFVGNRELLRSWVVYYLLMPFEGASLALIVYLLLRVGVLAPANSGDLDTSNLNFISLYAFAALTGLFSKQAIEKLADVFSNIFKKVEAKDAISDEEKE